MSEIIEVTSSAIHRLSNHGMTMKTIGLGLFGAGIGKVAFEDQHTTNSVYYLISVLLLGQVFIYVEAKYLTFEREFIEIQKQVLSEEWPLPIIDLSLIRENREKYPKTRLRSAYASEVIRPFILIEILITAVFVARSLCII